MSPANVFDEIFHHIVGSWFRPSGDPYSTCTRFDLIVSNLIVRTWTYIIWCTHTSIRLYRFYYLKISNALSYCPVTDDVSCIRISNFLQRCGTYSYFFHNILLRFRRIFLRWEICSDYCVCEFYGFIYGKVSKKGKKVQIWFFWEIHKERFFQVTKKSLKLKL